MSIATGRDDSWAAATSQLEAGGTVTDQLNSALIRSVTPSLASQLRVGLSKRRVLFVPRGQEAGEKTYVLTGFASADTYEFVLVNKGVVHRSDRCGGAIYVEVLTGFLKDLIGLATPEESDEVPEEEVAVVEETVVPEVEAEPEIVIPAGWSRP